MKEEEIMDGMALPGLPRELVLNILSRLPWMSNRRFRMVCRSWNSILNSPEFVTSMRTKLINGEFSPCLMSTNGYTVHVNLSLVRCDPSDSSSSSSTLPTWREFPLEFPTTCPLKVLVATAGCFLVRYHLDLDEHGQHVYFLFHPVYKCLKKVPAVPLPTLEGVFKSTRYVEVFTPSGIVSEIWNTAKLILVERFSIIRQVEYRRVENWRIYCYDAVMDKLNLVSDAALPPLVVNRLSNGDRPDRQWVKARFLKIRNVTRMRDRVFVLARPVHALKCTHNEERCMDHRYGHVLFMALPENLLDVSWQVVAEAPFAQLFQHRECLHLAIGTTSSSELPFKVEIWTRSLGSWNKIASMPEQHVDKLVKKMVKTELFRVVTEGDYVCFSRWMDSEVFIFYDLKTEVWKLVKFPEFSPPETDWVG